MKDTAVWRGWYKCCETFYVGFGWYSLPLCPQCKRESRKATEKDRQSMLARNTPARHDDHSLRIKAERLANSFGADDAKIARLLRIPQEKVKKLLAGGSD